MTDRKPDFQGVRIREGFIRAGLIWGLPEAPASNILLQNVSIQADLPFGLYNAEHIRFENCNITTPDGVNKLSTGNAKVTVTP